MLFALEEKYIQWHGKFFLTNFCKILVMWNVPCVFIDEMHSSFLRLLHSLHSLVLKLCAFEFQGPQDGSKIVTVSFFYIYKFCFYIYLFLRDRVRQRVSRGRSRERRRHRIRSRLLALSKSSAQSLTRGSNPQTVRSWPETKVGCSTDWATQVPHDNVFNTQK